MNRNAIMAINMDAGPDREGRPRRLYVLLDAGANVVDVIEPGKKNAVKALMDAGYDDMSTFGPVDVKYGVYREMLRQKRQGNPEIRHRRNGRERRRFNTALGATIGERDPGLEAMKQSLLTKGRRRL